MFLRIDAEPSINPVELSWLGQCINGQSVRLLNLEIKRLRSLFRSPRDLSRGTVFLDKATSVGSLTNERKEQ